MRQDMPGGHARTRPRSSILAAPSRPERAFERTFAPGTLLETEDGWQPIDRLRPGLRVRTLDGMTPISALCRQPPDRSRMHWHVPAGYLGNCSDIRLNAGQHVAVMDPACHSLFGADLVLLPVPTTTGFCGVRTISGFALRGGIALHFDSEQIVIAQTNMLVHVPGPDTEPGTDPETGTETGTGAETGHRVLSYRESRKLLTLLCERRRATDGPDRAPPPRADAQPDGMRPDSNRQEGACQTDTPQDEELPLCGNLRGLQG